MAEHQIDSFGTKPFGMRHDLVSDQSRARLYRPGRQHLLALSWITDASGACISVTQVWYEFTGRSREKSSGDGWMHCIHPLDRSRVETALRKAYAIQQPVGLEYRLRRADGTYAWVQHDATPQQDMSGKFQGFVHIAVDLVGIKRLEQNLLDKQAELLEQRDLAHSLLDLMLLTNLQQSTHAMLELIAAQAVHLLNAQIGMLYRISPDRHWLKAQVSVGMSPEIAEAMMVQIGEGTAGRAAQQQRCIGLDAIEVEALERLLYGQPELWEQVIALTQTVTRSLAVPIVAQNQLLGVLAVYRRESSGFNEDEIGLLSALSAQAGLVIQSERISKSPSLAGSSHNASGAMNSVLGERMVDVAGATVGLPTNPQLAHYDPNAVVASMSN